MVYLGELGEQRKRRFVVYLFDVQNPVGIECDDYNWNASGLVFYGSKREDSHNGFTVFATVPDQWSYFHELADGGNWPDNVTKILSEYGAMSRTSQGWMLCNPTP